jgi:hypothetical protein
MFFFLIVGGDTDMSGSLPFYFLDENGVEPPRFHCMQPGYS